MKILSNLTVDKTVNNVDVETLPTNEDLPQGTVDSESVGSLTNININTRERTITFTFTESEYTISELTIS